MLPAAVHRTNAAKFASWESIPRQQAYASVFVAFIRWCRCNLSKRWAVVHERNYYYYYYGRKWRWINSPEVIVRPMCAHSGYSKTYRLSFRSKLKPVPPVVVTASGSSGRRRVRVGLNLPDSRLGTNLGGPGRRGFQLINLKSPSCRGAGMQPGPARAAGVRPMRITSGA